MSNLLDLHLWAGSAALLLLALFINGVLRLPQRLVDSAGGGRSWYELDLLRLPPNAANLLTIVGRYSAAVRRQVAIDHFTFDVALPITYGLFLVLSIAQLGMAVAGRLSLLVVLVVLPAAASIFDLLENAGIVLICLNPSKGWTSPVATATGWLTIGKFLALALSVACVAVLLLTWISLDLRRT